MPPRRARRVDRVIVATDDERIAEAVRGVGGEPMLTSPHGVERHGPRGRGRAPRARGRLRQRPGRRAPHARRERRPRRSPRCWTGPGRRIATLSYPLSAEAAAGSQHGQGRRRRRTGARCISRASPIPYFRNGEPAYRKHLGIYAFLGDTLHELAALPPSAARARRVSRAAALAGGGAHDLGGGSRGGLDRSRHARRIWRRPRGPGRRR